MLALAAFGATALFGQAQPAPKILIVDLSAVFQGHYKTAEQQAVMQAQAQKAEQDLGVLNKEIDALVTQYKDIVDNAETLKVQIEAKGQAGVLSRLFGSHVGEKARELPGGGLDALETDKLLLDAVEVPNTIDWSESSKS